MRRVAFGSGVIVLMAVLAFTNLNTVFHPGHFEAKFPAWSAAYPAPTVVVEDRTGFVMAMAASGGREPFAQPDDRSLVISWLGGCSDDIVSLTLYNVGGSFVVDKQTIDNGCALDVGIQRSVMLVLRAPIDARRVQFDAFEASVT